VVGRKRKARIAKDNEKGRVALAQYIIRNTFSLEKLTYLNINHAASRQNSGAIVSKRSMKQILSVARSVAGIFTPLDICYLTG
jgi:hypothetical protein